VGARWNASATFPSGPAIASRSTRLIGSQQVLAWVMVTGLAIMVVVAPAAEGRPPVSAHGLAWALLGGTAAVAGLGLVYGTLFGIGRLVLGELGQGLLWCLLAVVCGAVIARSLRKPPVKVAVAVLLALSALVAPSAALAQSSPSPAPFRPVLKVAARNTVLDISNANKDHAGNFTMGLQRAFQDNWSGSLFYTYPQVCDVQSLTSSTAFANYRFGRRWAGNEADQTAE